VRITAAEKTRRAIKKISKAQRVRRERKLDARQHWIGTALIALDTCSTCHGPIDENDECRCGGVL
jgi:hypothetical protein